MSTVDRLTALLAAGESALSDDGDLNAGRRYFDAAYRIAETRGDAHAMVSAAIGLGGLWVHEQRTAAGLALLRERLVLADRRGPSTLRLRIRLAGEDDYRRGEHAAILALLEEARAAGDLVAQAEALSLAHHCLLGPEHGELRRRLAEELVALSVRTGRRGDLMMGLLWQNVDLMLAAHRQSGRRLTELRGLLADREHLAVGFVIKAIDVLMAIRAADLDGAERLAGVAAERGLAAGDIDAAGWHFGQMLTIRWYQGRVAELRPVLEQMTASPLLSGVDYSPVAAYAVAAAASGDRLKAVGALATLRGQGLSELPSSSTWLVTLNAVVEAACLLGEAELAEEAYGLLLPYAALPMILSLGVACFGSTQHALGVAALTIGDNERAIAHLTEAVRANHALAHWPAVLDSRVRLAQALHEAGRAGDARRELEAAHREAAPLGLTPLDHGSDVAAVRSITCVREGRGWRVTRGSRSVRVPHSVGMFHLSVLLANPGRELPAVELAAGPGALGLEKPARRSDQEVLDRTAVAEYRRRLAELTAEIEALQARGRHGQAADRTTERDWLLAELSRSTGLAGRSRSFTDDPERARIAVGKAIRRALDRLGQADQAIGDYLRRTVHTGRLCCYRAT